MTNLESDIEISKIKAGDLISVRFLGGIPMTEGQGRELQMVVGLVQEDRIVTFLKAPSWSLINPKRYLKWSSNKLRKIKQGRAWDSFAFTQSGYSKTKEIVGWIPRKILSPDK